jgi:hypothetical protein
MPQRDPTEVIAINGITATRAELHAQATKHRNRNKRAKKGCKTRKCCAG